MPSPQIESSLRAGAGIFDKLIEQRNQQITAAAAILSRDLLPRATLPAPTRTATPHCRHWPACAGESGPITS